MTENEVARIVVDAIVSVHSVLGPGLYESVYETCLEYELQQRGLSVKRQWPIPVVYHTVKLEDGFRMDLLVEDKVVVEIKSVEELAKVHFKQVITYLKLSGKRLGILVNFNVDLAKDGLRRVVFKLPEEPKSSIGPANSAYPELG